MKRNQKKSLSTTIATVLLLLMVFTIIPGENYAAADGISISSVEDRLSSWEPLFKGKYWNAGLGQSDLQKVVDNGTLDALNVTDAQLGLTDHPCSAPNKNSKKAGSCTSNRFRDSSQCRGFSMFIEYALFRSHTNSKDWTTIYSDLAELQPGDLIVTDSHNAVVWKVEKDRLYCVQCQGGSKSGCAILWGEHGFWGSDISTDSASKMVSFINKTKSAYVKRYSGINPNPSKTDNIIEDKIPTITLTEEKSPTALAVGKGFGLRGIIKTDVGKITKVYGCILDRGGSVVQERSVAPNEKKHNIRYSINESLLFGKLVEGFYTYLVTAEAVNGNKSTLETLIKKEFQVGNPGYAVSAAVEEPVMTLQSPEPKAIEYAEPELKQSIDVENDYSEEQETVKTAVIEQEPLLSELVVQTTEVSSGSQESQMSGETEVTVEVTVDEQIQPEAEVNMMNASPIWLSVSNTEVNIDRASSDSAYIQVSVGGTLPEYWYLNLAAAGPFICEWTSDWSFSINAFDTGVAELDVLLCDGCTDAVLAKQTIWVSVTNSAPTDTEVNESVVYRTEANSAELVEMYDYNFLISSAIDPNYVLDISGGESEGDNLQLYENRGSSNQLFKIIDQGNGLCRIINVRSGLDLSATGTGECNDNVVQAAYTGAMTQLWLIEGAEDGTCFIINAAYGEYLDVSNAWAVNGTNVALFDRNPGYAAQDWYITAV